MDAYELIEASSTVTGDVWTMLNNLGSGGGAGVGQVVAELEGTVITSEEFTVIIDNNDLNVAIDLDTLECILVEEEGLEVTIEEIELEGEVEEC